MNGRGVPAICLSEDIEAGGYYFMLLHSGCKIHAFSWREVPIHNNVIERVEELATIEKQPKLQNKTPLFEWSPGNKIDDLDEDDETVMGANMNLENEDDDREIDNLDEDEESHDNPIITDDKNEEENKIYEDVTEEDEEIESLDKVNHDFDEEIQEEDETFFENNDNDNETRSIQKAILKTCYTTSLAIAAFSRNHAHLSFPTDVLLYPLVGS